MSTDIKAHSPWTTTHKSRQTISVSSENTPNPIRLNCRCGCLRRLSPSEHSSPERCSCFSIRGFRLGQTSHRKPLDITRDYVLPSRDWCRTTERIYATRRLRAANVWRPQPRDDDGKESEMEIKINDLRLLPPLFFGLDCEPVVCLCCCRY